MNLFDSFGFRQMWGHNWRLLPRETLFAIVPQRWKWNVCAGALYGWKWGSGCKYEVCIRLKRSKYMVSNK